MMRPCCIYAFAAAVLGGLDSPIGAVVGGVVLGVVLNLLGAYVDFFGRTCGSVALAVILLVLLSGRTGSSAAPR